MLSNFKNNVTGNFSTGFGKASGFLKSGSPLSKIISAVIILTVFITIYNFAGRILKYIKDYYNSKPWIVKGTKNAKKRLVVIQDPSKDGAITLQRSTNEEGGIEFTYAFWMYIDDWSYKYGQWKHILHKGNVDSWPNRAPGIWLHPKENKLRVYMNTFKKIGEFCDVDNIPLNKWCHVIVMVRQKELNIFINGNLRKKHDLEALPKQNSGDLYINSFRGFSGYLSNLRYYNYVVSYADIDELLKKGPSNMPCVDTGETPPYLSPNWWISDKK